MRWKLQEYLDQHGITPQQLSLEAHLAVTTVYPMARGEARRVDLDTLDRVLKALHKLTQKPTTLDDVLEYNPSTHQESPLEDEGALLESGLSSFADALDDLEADVPEAERNAWLEAFMLEPAE